MSDKTRKISPEVVRTTKFYNSLSPVMQKIIITRGNIMRIENAYRTASNLDFEIWNKYSRDTYVNRMLVKELMKDKISTPEEVKSV